MTGPVPSDEMLMAFADGALAEDEAGAVAAAIAENPLLAARVEAFRETGRRLAALARSQQDNVPDALVARIRQLSAEGRQQRQPQAADAAPSPVAPAIDLSAHRRARDQVARTDGTRRPVWQMPLAASILLALGLWGGFTLARNGAGPAAPAQLAVLDSAELDQALRSIPSGQRVALAGGGEVSVIASFLDDQGQFCREFEYDRSGQPTIVSVACRGDGAAGWTTQLAVLAAPADGSAYAPASSLDTLDAWLGAVGAGPAMPEDQEDAALAALN